MQQCNNKPIHTLTYCLAVDEDFIREIAIKRMRDGDKKVGKAGKGDIIII